MPAIREFELDVNIRIKATSVEGFVGVARHIDDKITEAFRQDQTAPVSTGTRAHTVEIISIDARRADR